MKPRLLVGSAIAFAFAGTSVASASDHAECSHLTMLKLPDVKVTEAVAVPAAGTGGGNGGAGFGGANCWKVERGAQVVAPSANARSERTIVPVLRRPVTSASE